MFFEKLRRRFFRQGRDTAIYSFTIILTVAIFYAFKAISSQDILAMISGHWSDEIFQYKGLIGIISVIVTAVLAVLIMYANRFLLKRRQREIGLYMVLGMSYRRIALRFGLEALLINIISVALGLALGIFGSQWLSLFFIRRFGVNLEQFQFVFSGQALVHTVLTFFVIILCVLFVMGYQIRRLSLIDLVNPGRRLSDLPRKSSLLYFIFLVLSVITLGTAYRFSRVAAKSLTNSGNFLQTFAFAVILGVIGTFMLMYSITGGLIRVLSRLRGFYYRNLRFTVLRQFHSRMADFWVSLSVVTLLLFFALSGLSFGAVMDDLLDREANRTKEAYAADVGGELGYFDMPSLSAGKNPLLSSLYPAFRATAESWMNDVLVPNLRAGDTARAASFRMYHTTSSREVVFADREGSTVDLRYDDEAELNQALIMDGVFSVPMLRIVRRGDAEQLFSSEGTALNPLREYPADQSVLFRGRAAAENKSMEKFFTMLKEAQYGIRLTVPEDSETRESRAESPTLHFAFSEETPDDFLRLFRQTGETGFILFVSDTDWQTIEASERLRPYIDLRFTYLVNVPENDLTYVDAYQFIRHDAEDAPASYFVRKMPELEALAMENMHFSLAETLRRSTLMKAIVTLLVIYLGSIFLIATASVLALQHLTEISDNRRRYALMEKLGVSRRQLAGQVIIQTSIYFALPLLLASFHTIFSRRMIGLLMTDVGLESNLSSMLPVILIVLALYGGYYVITSLLGVKIAFERDSERN